MSNIGGIPFGEKVPLIRRTGRRGSEVVHVEIRPGLSRELPPWMFDSTIRKAMTLGSPQVEVASLTIRILTASRSPIRPAALTSPSG